MDVLEAMTRLGGVATARQLVALVGRRGLQRALESGLVWRAGRGRYVLPTTAARRQAVALHGTVSHLSAAQHWGWAVKWPAERPWVTVPRHRSVAPGSRARAHVVYADLGGAEILGGVTSPLRTALDCARRLPFDEALAVADSALRSRLVGDEELALSAARIRGPRAAVCRRVAAEATRSAANPFESTLRALCLDFPLEVEPQGPVLARGRTYHPDLVARRGRLAIEADSWEFHSGKEAHGRDCARYTDLTVAGWRVIRFTWEQVMLDPGHVRGILGELVEQAAPR